MGQLFMNGKRKELFNFSIVFCLLLIFRNSLNCKSFL